MFTIILSYIAAFALGGVIGSTIVSITSNREVRDLEKNTKYFENRCEQLQTELNHLTLK